jgi:hypothetical protein
MGTNVSGTVDPAVGPGVLVTTLADDSSTVQMVLQENEQQTKHNHECGGLVMQFEQGIVHNNFVSLEPF